MKLQSAMEYLMTYGWSILIIAVVLGALFGLGIFNGAASLGNGCLAQSGYLCQGAVLSTNGLLSVSIGQVGQPRITVVKAGCSNTSAEPSLFAALSPTLTLQAGQFSGVAFHCTLSSNTIGTSFTGTLWIEYNSSQYPGVTFPAEVGTISERAATLGNSSVGGRGGGPGGSSSSSSSSSSTTTITGGLSCGTPPNTRQAVSIEINSTLAVGILNNVNTSICSGRTLESWQSPITYMWSTTGSCPGWSNPGNVDNYTYTPSGTSSTCTIDVSVSDTSGDTGSGSTSPAILPPLVALISNSVLYSSSFIGITAANGQVYWVNTGNNTIDSIPVGGGRITILATVPGLVGHIATDGVNVYFDTQSDIDSVPVGGGPVTTLVSGFSSGTDAMATDGTNVYWANNQADQVGSVPVDGGGVTILASGYSAVEGVATDGTNVYFAYNGDAIGSVPVNGGPVTTLATGEELPIFLATDGRNVYWEDYNGYTIESVPVRGGPETTLVSNDHDAYGVATDGTNVYWASEGDGNYAVPVGGGTVTQLTIPTGNVGDLATDGRNIYWTAFEDGAVYQDPV